MSFEVVMLLYYKPIIRTISLKYIIYLPTTINMDSDFIYLPQ